MQGHLVEQQKNKMIKLLRRDIDKLEKIQTVKESRKRVELNADLLPSVCFYTFLNAYQRYFLSHQKHT